MKIRVLLVDDEQEFAGALAQRLEVRNLLVKTAASGPEALKQLDDVDVVLLDMVMPGQDGIVTLQEIKQRKPLVEVILLTGYGTLESAVKALELGAFHYLLKPAELTELLENIAGAFKRKADHEERIRQAEIKRLLMAAGQE
jgi:two-component system, OmpR family, response regulator CpxR